MPTQSELERELSEMADRLASKHGSDRRAALKEFLQEVRYREDLQEIIFDDVFNTMASELGLSRSYH
jgi:hypothetical protein